MIMKFGLSSGKNIIEDEMYAHNVDLLYMSFAKPHWSCVFVKNYYSVLQTDYTDYHSDTFLNYYQTESQENIIYIKLIINSKTFSFLRNKKCWLQEVLYWIQNAFCWISNNFNRVCQILWSRKLLRSLKKIEYWVVCETPINKTKE